MTGSFFPDFSGSDFVVFDFGVNESWNRMCVGVSCESPTLAVGVELVARPQSCLRCSAADT
jgi:hypothetical protein